MDMCSSGGSSAFSLFHLVSVLSAAMADVRAEDLVQVAQSMPPQEMQATHAVESTPMPEAQSVDVTAVAEAALHASAEIALAATAGHFTAAEVPSAPTAEEFAEVAAELQSCEEVAIESTPMPETQFVDVTAAAEAATHASDEIALAAPVCRFTPAEFASAPIAEELAEVRQASQVASWVQAETIEADVASDAQKYRVEGPTEEHESDGSVCATEPDTPNDDNVRPLLSKGILSDDEIVPASNIVRNDDMSSEKAPVVAALATLRSSARVHSEDKVEATVDETAQPSTPVVKALASDPVMNEVEEATGDAEHANECGVAEPRVVAQGECLAAVDSTAVMVEVASTDSCAGGNVDSSDISTKPQSCEVVAVDAQEPGADHEIAAEVVDDSDVDSRARPSATEDCKGESRAPLEIDSNSVVVEDQALVPLGAAGASGAGMCTFDLNAVHDEASCQASSKRSLSDGEAVLSNKRARIDDISSVEATLAAAEAAPNPPATAHEQSEVEDFSDEAAQSSILVPH